MMRLNDRIFPPRQAGNLAHAHLRSFLMVLGILFAGLLDESRACNVPAFRYALERWPADPYQILVYYQTAPQGGAFDLLQKGAEGRGGAANYMLKGVDVTKPEGDELARQQKIVSYPWVEIFYPAHSQVRIPIWSGPLTTERVKRILDSPLRSGLARRLLAGDVAVWILIKSGHEQKDRRALEALKVQLERASATLRIPEIGTDLNGNPIEVTDFRTYPVRFSLMEVARDDPDEELLVNALLMSEPDLSTSDEPVAIPVFGRGRALYALVGNGIQDRNIMEACRSMLAWCSCEIKAQNPGTDLLVSADWSRPYGGKMVQDPELPLTGLGGFVEDQVPPETAEPASKTSTAGPAAAGPAEPAVSCAAGAAPASVPAQAQGPRENPLMRNVFYLAGALGLVLLALSLFVTMKMKR